MKVRHGIALYRTGCRCKVCRYAEEEYHSALARYVQRPLKLVEPVVFNRSIKALGKGNRAELVTYLLERDGNRCRIPRCLYTNRRMGPGPRRPSIDHIIPLTKGGLNELANIQLAHLRCNISKKNRGVGDQLALLG
jgi:5-methylcytosine-specific restriction endonuclease McrA